ncbi:hypothetical protein EDD86DRAFT_66244 [Gorgonomyces haynaldii]|nr:hypothetical protein EDD86DRAFT_66244 [Gorgonomyces haynaldii]
MKSECCPCSRSTARIASSSKHALRNQQRKVLLIILEKEDDLWDMPTAPGQFGEGVFGAEKPFDPFAKQEIPPFRFIPPQWVYKDPEGNLQGPFSSEQMHAWYKEGYFPPGLPIKCDGDPVFIPLFQLLEKYGTEAPFLESLLEQEQLERQYYMRHVQQLRMKNTFAGVPLQQQLAGLPSHEQQAILNYLQHQRKEESPRRSPSPRLELGFEPLPLDQVERVLNDGRPRVVERPQERVAERPQERVVERPQERVVERPIERVIEKPVTQKPAKPAIEKPVQKIEKPIQKVEKPVEHVIEKPVQKMESQKIPVERVVEKPIERVIEKPVERPVEKPVERVIERPVEKTEEIVEKPQKKQEKKPEKKQEKKKKPEKPEEEQKAAPLAPWANKELSLSKLSLKEIQEAEALEQSQKQKEREQQAQEMLRRSVQKPELQMMWANTVKQESRKSLAEIMEDEAKQQREKKVEKRYADTVGQQSGWTKSAASIVASGPVLKKEEAWTQKKPVVTEKKESQQFIQWCKAALRTVSSDLNGTFHKSSRRTRECVAVNFCERIRDDQDDL